MKETKTENSMTDLYAYSLNPLFTVVHKVLICLFNWTLLWLEVVSERSASWKRKNMYQQVWGMLQLLNLLTRVLRSPRGGGLPYKKDGGARRKFW